MTLPKAAAFRTSALNPKILSEAGPAQRDGLTVSIACIEAYSCVAVDTMLTLKAGSACAFSSTRPARAAARPVVLPSSSNVLSGVSVGQRADGA